MLKMSSIYHTAKACASAQLNFKMSDDTLRLIKEIGTALENQPPKLISIERRNELTLNFITSASKAV